MSAVPSMSSASGPPSKTCGLLSPDSPLPAAPSRPSPAAYGTAIASTPEEVRAAQRLRYLVFAEEKGAWLHTPLPGHDIDAFGDDADHLVVTDQRDGTVVGTYRLTPPGRREQPFSDGEFDLSGLPAHERDFGDADFFVPLDMERMNDRYRRCFLGEERTGQ